MCRQSRQRKRKQPKSAFENCFLVSFDSWRDVKNDFKYTTVIIACFLHEYKYFCLSKTEFDRPKKQIGYEGEEKKNGKHPSQKCNTNKTDLVELDETIRTPQFQWTFFCLFQRNFRTNWSRRPANDDRHERKKNANYKLKTEFLCYVQLKIPQSRKHAHVRIFFTQRLTKSHSGQCLYLKHGAHVCVRATNRHGGTCYTKPVQHDLCDVVMHKLAVWFALSLSYKLFFMLLLLEFCEWLMLSEWCDANLDGNAYLAQKMFSPHL